MPEAKHPTVDEVLVGALFTIENQLLPQIEDTWARAAASQLMGTLEYARVLIAGDESVDTHTAEVEAALVALLAAHPELGPVVAGAGGETTGFTAQDKASCLLSFAVTHTTPGAEAIRKDLRPLITRQADANLKETMTMLTSFGGRPRNAER